MTGVFIRERRFETHRDTEEKSCEDGGRDLSDVLTSQGMPGPIGSWKRQGGFSPGASEGSLALPTPWFQTLGV